MNPTLTLNNGVQIPRLGLGLFQMENGDDAVNAVCWATAAGYRHLDTAAAYDNEQATGEGIRRCGVPREELFVTSKLWNEDMRKRNTRAALKESLHRLGLDYLDLYLIHWPAEGYAEAWCEMEQLHRQGLVRAIGVSNFQPHHLESLAKVSATVPAVNQIECHTRFSQKPLRGYCKDLGILCEAWSPLGGSKSATNQLQNETLVEIATRLGRTPAQVVLRWQLQNGLVVIPKSVRRQRIEQNGDLWDFALGEEDMNRIDSLDRGERVGPDPDNFDF